MSHGNQKVTDGKLMAELRSTNDPYLTAGELADRLNMTRQGVHRRLMELYENGKISRKKTGRTVGWWID